MGVNAKPPPRGLPARPSPHLSVLSVLSPGAGDTASLHGPLQVRTVCRRIRAGPSIELSRHPPRKFPRKPSEESVMLGYGDQLKLAGVRSTAAQRRLLSPRRRKRLDREEKDGLFVVRVFWNKVSSLNLLTHRLTLALWRPSVDVDGSREN